MRSRYERLTELDEVLERAGKLSLRALIFDIEPLVSWWNSTQEALDLGVAMVVSKVSMLPTLRVLVFATNSVRRPSAIPAGRDIDVVYLAAAGKPLRTAPYRGLPRPGAVVGDQVPTDGLLARRLGFTFLYYDPRLADVPVGPKLMHRVGRLALPLLFSRQEEDLSLGSLRYRPTAGAPKETGVLRQAGLWSLERSRAPRDDQCSSSY
jgi:predicted HAD superfamily phosphohydrolase YqeG